MKDIAKYIDSGILERYVTGDLSPTEMREVEQVAYNNPEVRATLDELQSGLGALAMSVGKRPPIRAKENFFEALQKQIASETFDPKRPKVLNPASRAEDYKYWLELPEMKPPESYDNIFFIEVANNDDGMSAIVWMKEGAEAETHVDCLEKFLIVEGTCEIEFEGKKYELGPGSYLNIPLFATHEVNVTSTHPCKIFLQRITA